MATYKCLKDGCSGTLSFADKPTDKGSAKTPTRPWQRGFELIVLIEDEPVACPICGTSYFERELRQP
ncbi:MAG: hypothetical protein GX576_08640 [Thauera phenolivorans]|uniref:Uncharacterized protein n=1 Tax=Thauera phenolivorans TaxID=1792543 RepID=A0A7X7LWD0_9RHOO|nr:hypothetical protein [Thauera phenolivorans]